MVIGFVLTCYIVCKYNVYLHTCRDKISYGLFLSAAEVLFLKFPKLALC